METTTFVKTCTNHNKKKSSKFTKKFTHIDDMMIHNFVKYLVQTRFSLWDIKIINLCSESTNQWWPRSIFTWTNRDRHDEIEKSSLRHPALLDRQRTLHLLFLGPPPHRHPGVVNLRAVASGWGQSSGRWRPTTTSSWRTPRRSQTRRTRRPTRTCRPSSGNACARRAPGPWRSLSDRWCTGAAHHRC